MKALLRDVREMLDEQVEFHELLRQMSKRDLLLRYKQTAAGLGWAVFSPLINTVIFSVIFMRVAKIETGMPYPLFAFSGLLLWTFFSSSLKFALTSLTSNGSLVSKIYFPREIFPFTSVVVCLVDFAVSLIVLGVFMAYYRVPPQWTIVFLPIVVLVLVAFTAGMALILSMANLFFRDVKYVFEVVLMVWMFASSVLYPVSLAGGMLGLVMRLNPVTPMIEAFRSVMFRGQHPFTPEFLAAAVVSVLVLLGGWVMFHRAESLFAESI